MEIKKLCRFFIIITLLVSCGLISVYAENNDIKKGNIVEDSATLISNTEKEQNTTVLNFSDAEVIIKNNRVLVPIRNLAELIGCKVSWDGDTKTAYVKNESVNACFIIDEKQYIVNGVTHFLDVSAEIYNSKTYIPLRAAAESLGLYVVYNDSDKTVTLSKYKYYNKIANYLHNESVDTFSIYYELLDFVISDYSEVITDKDSEILLNYTLVYKNFDKDPDTVNYIKAAKEKNDPNYTIYYKEYLQPKEMNFEIRIIADKDGILSMYTDTDPTSNRNWTEFKMSDCILKK